MEDTADFPGLPEQQDITIEDRPKSDELEDVDKIAKSNDSEHESAASGSSNGSHDSEMEPFEEYLPKIKKLLSEIGLIGFSVEPLHHGYNYMNCVYALRSVTDEKEKYVLRVPTCPLFKEENSDDGRCSAILNDAACLGYLAGVADALPVPRVRAYCATKENALGTPYMVQTMLPGQSLDNVFDDMSQTEKLAVIDQFVGLLAQLEEVTFTTAGTFTFASGAPDTMHNFLIPAAPSIKIFDEGPEEFVKKPQSLQDRAGPDLKALLISHIKGFIELELSKVELNGRHRSDRLQPELEMIEQLDRDGCFQDGPFPIVLHHWDLEPRNIMVENSTGSWRFCGLIDWDDAIVLPRPLSRKPPSWIWEPDPEGFTGYLDCDHQPNSSTDPNHKLSEEGMTLKAYFDAKAEATLPGYLEDAYGRGRWLRRIWLFARKEIHDTWYLDLMDLLKKDWDARLKLIEPQSEESTELEPGVSKPQTPEEHQPIGVDSTLAWGEGTGGRRGAAFICEM